MKIVNFSHPLTAEQLLDIERLISQEIKEVITVTSEVNTEQDLAPQIEAMLESTGLSSHDWQTQNLIFNLPALHFSAAVMLAILHGRMGHFPTILRLRPKSGSVPSRYEVAELINLQTLREKSRLARNSRT